MIDPLAGAVELPTGTLFYTVEDKELGTDVDEEKLYNEFKKIRAGVPIEDTDIVIKAAESMEEMSPFTEDKFIEVLDREFNVFKGNEKYDYVKDLTDAYKDSLSKSNAEKIFDTIPVHVFWDIKTPQVPDQQRFMNPYNSFRKYHVQSFFDHREYEEFHDRRIKK